MRNLIPTIYHLSSICLIMKFNSAWILVSELLALNMWGTIIRAHCCFHEISFALSLGDCTSSHFHNYTPLVRLFHTFVILLEYCHIPHSILGSLNFLNVFFFLICLYYIMSWVHRYRNIFRKSLRMFLSDLLVIVNNVKHIFRVVNKVGKIPLRFHKLVVRVGRTQNRIISSVVHFKPVSPLTLEIHMFLMS